MGLIARGRGTPQEPDATAIAERDLERAKKSVDTALPTMANFEVPLAAWRVHATAADLYARMRNRSRAEQHRELSRATVMTLANSLPQIATLIERLPVSVP